MFHDSSGAWALFAIVCIGGVIWALVAAFSSDQSADTSPVTSAREPAPTAISDPPTPTSSEPVRPQTHYFATAADAKQEALRRYPALGIAGSKLNTDFVARYKLYQQQRPEYFQDNSWPLRLAEELTQTPESK